MSKNNMRTPEEKEKILKEFYLGNLGRNEICRKYNISTRTLADWRIKYEESGIDGLKSNTGKSKGGNKGLGLKKGKTNEEKLKIMKLEIENARLKKGYLVKGGGDQKEYVTTLDENTK